MKLIKKEDWKWIALSGFVGSFFPAFFFAIAETEIDSAVASILNSLVPLNTVLLGAAVFKIATNTRQVIGIVIGFVGTSILILEGADLNPNQNYWYAGFVIATTIMYAINVNVIKTYLQHVKPLSIAAGNYVIIFIPALLVLILTDFFNVENLDQSEFVSSIGFVVVLSFFGTALAKVLFNKLVQMSTPVFASSVTYIMPIVALIWGLLDNETLQKVQNFNFDGMVVNKEIFQEHGGLKKHMKLTFTYEFLLRLSYLDVQIMVIPKLGYKHINNRPDSLFDEYKNTVNVLESKFWVNKAKKEYFFTEDREITYDVETT